jgi:hypothetical protein
MKLFLVLDSMSSVDLVWLPYNFFHLFWLLYSIPRPFHDKVPFILIAWIVVLTSTLMVVESLSNLNRMRTTHGALAGKQTTWLRGYCKTADSFASRLQSSLHVFCQFLADCTRIHRSDVILVVFAANLQLMSAISSRSIALKNFKVDEIH